MKWSISGGDRPFAYTESTVIWRFYFMLLRSFQSWQFSCTWEPLSVWIQLGQKVTLCCGFLNEHCRIGAFVRVEAWIGWVSILVNGLILINRNNWMCNQWTLLIWHFKNWFHWGLSLHCLTFTPQIHILHISLIFLFFVFFYTGILQSG